MSDKKNSVKKIKSLYPDIGEYGIDVNTDLAFERNAWTVALKKDVHELRHSLEPADVEACMGWKLWVGLDLEVTQLKKYVCGGQFMMVWLISASSFLQRVADTMHRRKHGKAYNNPLRYGDRVFLPYWQCLFFIRVPSFLSQVPR